MLLSIKLISLAIFINNECILAIKRGQFYMNIDYNNRLKRLRNNYQLTVTNEDTFEEVVKFKLTRLSVYIALSTFFISMVIITASLIVFTPLKYYLPGTGYGNIKQIKAFERLKIRTDSMQIALDQQKTFNEDIQKVLKGNRINILFIKNTD